ncbi:MAG: hypothetical protein CL424_06330 [Acidimicrobiaceae bacterium]|nr:hypothetical protein [Acidimicrobiaceae bacterium]
MIGVGGSLGSGRCGGGTSGSGVGTGGTVGSEADSFVIVDGVPRRRPGETGRGPATSGARFAR